MPNIRLVSPTPPEAENPHSIPPEVTYEARHCPARVLSSSSLTEKSIQERDLFEGSQSVAARASFTAMPDEILEPTPKMITFAESQGWDMLRIHREAMKFWAFYAANGREAKNWFAMWVAWVLRGIERDQPKLGSLEDRCQKSAQAAAVLSAIARGGS